MPVGIVIGKIDDNRLEPHVFWFPWATPRNMLECTIKFLDTMRKAWTIIIFSEEKNHKWFKKIERYGVIRQVGKIDKYYPNGETASVFQNRSQE